MADELSLIKQQMDLIRKELEVNVKGSTMEFEKISTAFQQLGNLLDLLYLEVSVLIEMLGKNKTIELTEYQKNLEETAQKIQEDMKKKKETTPAEPETPIIEKA